MQNHKLEMINQNGEFALVLYIDNQTEFANELGTVEAKSNSIKETAKNIISRSYPKLKITMVKVVLGGLVIASYQLIETPTSAAAQLPTNGSHQNGPSSSSIYHYVNSGETLWILSRQFNTTVQDIKRANNLTSDVLNINQRMVIPKAFHTVKQGDYLSVLARDYGTTVSAIREANQLQSDAVRLGQTLVIPMSFNLTQQSVGVVQQQDSTKQQTVTRTYTVVSGDSLSVIAQRLGVTTQSLREANQLTTDVIRVGQVLTIPGTNATPAPTPTQSTAERTYTVVSGDSLSVIAQRFGVSTQSLREANQLTTDVIRVGQVLTIPGTTVTPVPTPTPTSSQSTVERTYTVVSGDSLSVIAQRFGVTTESLRKENHLTTDVIRIGQVLTIPGNIQGAATTPEVKEAERKTFTYRVVSGDSLSVIAAKFGVSADAIRSANQLKTDTLQIGQTLTIQNGLNAPTNIAQNSISYRTHIVVSGDNIWDLSVRYGIPQSELLRANNLTTSSALSIGQRLTIPVHNIAVKETVTAKHGELLDWWTEAQYVFPIGKTAKVTDFLTGKSFYIKRTIGANHADSETISVNDTNIAKAIWGGFSWTPRAVIVEVDDRKLAASMSFMPHERQYIMNNGITGHFDVYFSKSTRHVDGRADSGHQAQVERAAGLR
ncbi:LysM peptidoglycan-binding domain-containing protein [Bacillus sp. B15-48]|uniref:LysM peptidoglycan-binding domain-containing protein n=1 Tax=Bacillus sp. B15-48 TaxID=1548601 RepID=UPI00193F3BE3